VQHISAVTLLADNGTDSVPNVYDHHVIGYTTSGSAQLGSSPATSNEQIFLHY